MCGARQRRARRRVDFLYNSTKNYVTVCRRECVHTKYKIQTFHVKHERREHSTSRVARTHRCATGRRLFWSCTMLRAAVVRCARAVSLARASDAGLLLARTARAPHTSHPFASTPTPSHTGEDNDAETKSSENGSRDPRPAAGDALDDEGTSNYEDLMAMEDAYGSGVSASDAAAAAMNAAAVTEKRRRAERQKARGIQVP